MAFWVTEENNTIRAFKNNSTIVHILKKSNLECTYTFILCFSLYSLQCTQFDIAVVQTI